jgi:signal transduction histidine kinase
VADVAAQRRWPRARWRSVRARTTVVAAVVVGVALAAGATILLLSLQDSLVRSGDATAVSKARDLAAVAGSGGLPATVTAPGEDDVVQVVASGGRVVAASANARGWPPITSFRPDGAAPAVHTVYDVLDGTEPEDYRVWGVRAGTAQQPMFVYVGTSLEAVSEATARLRATLAVGLPVMLALLAFSTWLLLGRTLRPVEAIRSEVSEISAKALDRRVPVPATDDEISRLAETMNAMLDRLEAASRRQREFVADASHELRSPLSAFRAQLEVALAHPAEADWQATAVELLADSDRMERIVGDLLYLARTDALPPEPSATLVDLDDIVLDEVNRLRAHATVQIDTSQVSAAPVRGSGEELRRLIRNLLDNAVRHAKASVRVELVTIIDEVVLAVEDDGPGVPTEQRTRIFERFVRLDDARSPEEGGTGLGLAIVHAIAARHGGRVALEPSADGARLVVRLVAPA